MGKKLMGAQMSAIIWDGVDRWLAQHRNMGITDFLQAAILEKLEREHIPIDRDAALRDERHRVPQGVQAEANINYLKSKPKKPKS
jgi:hypothetical protein